MIRLWCLLAVLAAALAAGCGSTTEVREPDLVVSAAGTSESDPGEEQAPRDDGRTRIAVVTHGQAADPFWKIVRNGVEAAARESDVVTTYQSPDLYSIDRMRRLINDAVDTRPDGLVVSMPSRDLIPAVRRAVLAGIPVVSINSGSDLYERLGVLAHVGQVERRAGRAAGERLARGGARRALCVIQEVGNAGLQERCRGLTLAMRAVGGTVEQVPVDINEVRRSQVALRDAIERTQADAVLTLGSSVADIGLGVVAGDPRIRLASFDLSPEILRAVRAGRMLFAVDQQPYLQGYLPVLFLGQHARFGIFPSQGEIFATGPHFVTRATAAKALLLSRRGIR